MGDTSDTKSEDIKAGGAARADDKGAATADERMAAAGGWLGRSWIGRHWRGQLRLVDSFYINGLLCNVTLYGVVWLANWTHPREAFRVAVWVFIVAAEAWFAVGVWRSAGRYAGPLFWAIVARLWVVGHFYLLLKKFVPPGLPKLPS